MEEGGRVVIAASDQAIWTHLPNIHTVDDLRVPNYLPDGGTRVPQENGTKPAIHITGTITNVVFDTLVVKKGEVN